MRRIGRIVAATAIALCSLRLAAGAVSLDADLESRRIAAGESTTLRISVSGAQGVKPVTIPTVPGLSIQYAGMGQSISIVNMQMSKSVILNFSVTGERPGSYRIPPLVFDIDGRRLRSPELALTVVKGTVRPESEGGVMSIEPLVEFSRRQVYAGEPVIMRYYLLTAGTRVSVDGFEKLPVTKGFVIKDFEERVDETTVVKNGITYVKSHITTMALIATQTGTQQVGGGTAIISYEVSGGIFPFSQRRRLVFDTQGVNVLPLPDAGKPADFQGDVGSFSIKAEVSPDPVSAYQEKKVTLTVSGRGNLLSLTKPALEREPADARVLAADGESEVQVQGGDLQGKRSFVYSFIPEKSGELQCGSFVMNIFNPATRRYEKLLSNPVVLTVREGEGKRKGLDFEKEGDRAVEFNPLYVAGILLVIAGIVILVVLWERRKYTLAMTQGEAPVAASPHAQGIEDRRALLAQCRSAYRRGDAAAFLRAFEKTLDASLHCDAPPAETARHRLQEIKDRLYQSRFAGVPLTKEELELMYREIEELVG